MIHKDYSFLLERPEWNFDEAGIDAALANKRVLITGAGGSIGSALANRVANSPAQSLAVIGHSELPIFNLCAKLADSKVPVHSGIFDVGSDLFSNFIPFWRPDIVLHAAAHKHVGLMQAQPEAAFKNNTEATILLAKSAVRSKARFIFISTDKAVNPTSIMGSSKRLAEAWLLTHVPDARICRFGNVLGSSGSLVEILERRIAAGESIKLTSPEMKRYFITAHEAVGLVLTSGLLLGAGLYSLEMCEQVPIVNIAKKLGPNSVIEWTNPGSGEKFDEEVIGHGEEKVLTFHPGIFQVESNLLVDRVEWAFRQVRGDISQLQSVAHRL